MNLFILFCFILMIPIFFILFALVPILKRVYGRAEYENVGDHIENHLLSLLVKINKNSYIIKKMDENLEQEPCIAVTKNGVLVNEHKIKNLSDNALISGLLYEIITFEKNIYIVQLIINIFFSVCVSALFVYGYQVYGVDLSSTRAIIFYSMALIVPPVLLERFSEYINFVQKRNIISVVIGNDKSNLDGLKEYFAYCKSYFDHLSNIKYDIDKQLDFLDSIRD